MATPMDVDFIPHGDIYDDYYAPAALRHLQTISKQNSLSISRPKNICSNPKVWSS